VSRSYGVVGPGPLTGNIVMATVENRYLGKHGVPDTPYLLIVQVHDVQGFTQMTRVVGITKQTKNRFDKEGVPLIETNAHLEARLKEHFEASWAQLQECFHEGSGIKPLSNLIH
jgi:phosphoribosylaminoimidazole carboxylase (NCAIR synthetase)